MKIRWHISTLVTLCLFGTAQSAFADKPVLTFAADLWCPINCAEGSEDMGIGVDLITKIFEKQGYQVNYVVMPWTDALQEVRAGKIDGVIGATKADDPNLVFPENPLCEITDDFYVLKTNPWQYKDETSLPGLRIGIVQDYGYDPALAKYIAQNKTTPLVQAATGDDAQLENIKKLMAGQIDALVDYKAIVNYRLKKLEIDDKVRWAGGIRLGFAFVGFSQTKTQSKDLARLYDEGVEKLKAKDTLYTMYSHYGMTP